MIKNTIRNHKGKIVQGFPMVHDDKRHSFVGFLEITLHRAIVKPEDRDVPPTKGYIKILTNKKTDIQKLWYAFRTGKEITLTAYEPVPQNYWKVISVDGLDEALTEKERKYIYYYN